MFTKPPPELFFVENRLVGTFTCDLDAKYVLVCYLQLRLTNLQVFDQFPGQVTDSNAVLESVVRSAWKKKQMTSVK